MTKKLTTCSILLFSVLVAAQGVAHQGANLWSKPLTYDRVEIIRRLVTALYPDLWKGPSRIQWEIEGDSGRDHFVDLRTIRIYPCDPQSSVSGGHSQIPSSKEEPKKTPCGTAPTEADEDFLAVSVTLGADPARPVYRFLTAGSFVDGRLEELRQHWSGGKSPTEAEVVRSLVQENPKYGPDKKAELLKILPLKSIREITGCDLNPETAAFSAEYDQGRELRIDLQWHLSGKAPATKNLSATTCSSTFEPFEGHLTAFND